MKKAVVKIFEQYISALDFSQPIKTYVFSAGVSTISVDKLYYSKVGLKIKVDNVEFEISAIDIDKKEISFLTDEALTNYSILNLQPLQYFHGTTRAVSNQLSQLNGALNYTPFIYLHEKIDEDYYENEDSANDFDANLRFFFLDDSSEGVSWLTDDYYENVINKLRETAELFLEKLRYYPAFYKFKSKKIINITHFATYTDSTGYDKSLFTDKLAGVELQINLPFRKNFESCIL